MEEGKQKEKKNRGKRTEGGNENEWKWFEFNECLSYDVYESYEVKIS